MTVALPVVALAGVEQVTVSPVGGSHTPPALSATSADDSGVPPLPIVTDGGYLDSVAPDDAARRDARVLRGAVDVLGAQLGFDSAAQIAGSTWTWDMDSPRSYAWPELEDLVDDTLDREAVMADPSLAVDFSAALLMLSRTGSATEGVTGSEPYRFAPGLAWVVLGMAQDLTGSCEVSINRLHLITLGDEPELEDVDTETEAAELACGPDDPTPLWIRAKYLSTTTDVGEDIRLFDTPPAERQDLALAAFDDLVERFPTSPLGLAGKADLLLGWADQAESVASQPFQVRAWRNEALALYQRARALSSDGRLLYGQARATVATGDPDAALVLAEEAVRLLPEDLDARAVLAETMSSAGLHHDAAAAVADEANLPLPWWAGARPRFRFDVALGTYAVTQYPPLRVTDPAMGEYGGALADDRDFIPQTRYSDVDQYCRASVQLEQLVLANDFDAASAIADGDVNDIDGAQSTACTEYVPEIAPRHLAAIAYLGAGDDSALETVLDSDPTAEYQSDEALLGDTYDRWQDLLRRHGDLAGATLVAQQWIEALGTADAYQRQAETAYLDGNLEAARDGFAIALSRREQGDQSSGGNPEAPLTTMGPELDRALSMLQLATVQADLGDADSARHLLSDALKVADSTEELQTGYIKTHLASQLGLLTMRAGRWDEAADILRTAVRWGRAEDVYWQPVSMTAAEPERLRRGLLKGAQENNLALALCRAGDPAGAVQFARVAAYRDPANPVFRDTLAFALQAAGRPIIAAEAYRAAVDEDETSFVSLNNLGVVLARSGDRSGAVDVLRKAVGIEPDYALGWRNLGAALRGSWDPRDFVRSQASLARAARIDPDLRDPDQGLMMDESVYESGLDVSRAVPPDWSYAASASAPRGSFTWTMAVLIAFRVLWALLIERFGGRATERALDRVRAAPQGARVWWQRAWHDLPPAIGIGASVAVLVVATAWVGVTPYVFVVGCAAVTLVGAPLLARRLAASRRGVAVIHRTWMPSLAAGAVGVSAGLAFAPFPVLRSESEDRIVRWTGPLVLASFATILVLLAWVSAVPATRAAAACAVLLLTSVLTPVPPLDGSAVTRRLTAICTSLVFATLAVAFALKWV